MSAGVGQEDSPPVREVLLTGLGHQNKRPFLIAFVEQDLLIYEAFTFAESSLEGHLNLRFKKVCIVDQYKFVLQSYVNICWETRKKNLKKVWLIRDKNK